MYVDAGTGSMLLQAAAALLFSLLFFFKQIREGVRKLFHPSERRSEKK